MIHKKVEDAVKRIANHMFSVAYCDKPKGIKVEAKWCLEDNDRFWDSFWSLFKLECSKDDADKYRNEIIDVVKSIAEAKCCGSERFSFLFA